MGDALIMGLISSALLVAVSVAFGYIWAKCSMGQEFVKWYNKGYNDCRLEGKETRK